MRLQKNIDGHLTARLAASGFRSTAQREHVYGVLLQERDHPTAEQVFLRAKKAMPDISMATVYNCLDTLVKAGLVRQVTLDRAASRYCPNMHDHCHFHCTHCGEVFDIDFQENSAKLGFQIPQGFEASGCEIVVHGACPACTARREGRTELLYEHSD